MKCEFCGAALSLEMQYCPYCGKENTAVKQHVEDMKHFQGAFEQTKKTVYEKTNDYTHNTVKIAIVAVLAIIWVLLLILTANIYSIRRNLREAKNIRNFAEIEEQIWEYLEEEEYYPLAIYCAENNLDIYDSKFEQYIPIFRVIDRYRYTYEALLNLLTPYEYSSDTMEDQIGYLADAIEAFYNIYNRNWEEEDYNDVYDMERLQPELDKVEQRITALLQAYAGLTPEEAEQFSEMKESQRIMLLEEGFLNEK